MTRDDYKFYIHYSYVLEKMNYTLLTRIDKLGNAANLLI
ncbi:hypothetical protein ESCOMM145B2_22325 [Escherichia coli]